MNDVFCRNLKKMRKEKNLTQKSIAELLNIAQRTYAHYETGDREPSMETLILIANLYGTSIDYLVGRYEKRL